MKVEVFKKEHLEAIERQTGKVYKAITEANRHTLENNGMSYSVMGENGRVLLCAGLIHHWAGRAEGWAIFDKDMKKEFLAVHKKVLRFLEISPFKRIEAIVTIEFKQGHRWAKLLGFQVEGPRLRHYFENGKDAVLYARIG